MRTAESHSFLERRADADWMERAACAKPGVNPEWFFPDNRPGRPGNGYERRAKEVCVTCVVRSTCLADAYDIDDQWAVLGGLTAEERAKLARPRPRAVPA